MFRLSRISAGIAILAGSLVLAACAPQSGATRNGQNTGKPAPGQVDVTKPIKVAFLATTTAKNSGAATLGRALVNAARMAEGDLRGAKIELMILDTGGNAGQAVRAARQAIGSGAKIILGPLFSANTKAIASIAAANDVKVISFSTDSSVAGGPVFLSGFLPEKEAARVIGFARARGVRDTGILYPLTPAGEVALKGARDASGVSLVATTGYDRTAPGIVAGTSEFAAKVRSAGAVGLMVAESGKALVFAMDQLGEKGIETGDYRFLGLGQWNSRSILGSKRFQNAWFPAPDPDAMNRFVSRYQSQYGSPPPPLAVLGYDAVAITGQLLSDAKASGSNTPFTFAAITRPQGFRGAVGPVRFGRDGLVERGMVILEVGASGFNVIDRAPVVFGAGS